MAAILAERLLPGPTPLTSFARFASWSAAPATVTVKLAETVLGVSSASVAVQVTVVVPIANVEPDGVSQLTVAAVGSSGSVAVGGV